MSCCDPKPLDRSSAKQSWHESGLTHVATNPRRDFAPSAAEEASQWRRAGPLPARDAPTPRRGPSFAAESGERPPERDLDWGAARGARFTPAPPTSDFRRNSSGAGRERESQYSPGVADNANQWRSNKPAAVVVESAQRPGPRVGSGQSSPGLAETEQTVSLILQMASLQRPQLQRVLG